MAPSAISTGLEKLQETLDGSPEGRKVADMAKDTKNYHDPQNRITTDYGVKLTNTGAQVCHYTIVKGELTDDADDWLKVATEDKTGPQLLEDHAGREKIHSFDHERIPERVVHARGACAFGTFKLHKSMEKYSHANVLTDTSRSTPTFLRFSTVLGSRGSADTVRDVRGFAVKFYTDEGNWDIVGNNIPVRRPVFTFLASIDLPLPRSSSSRMLSSFLMSSMPASQSLTTRCPKRRQHTTTSGTSSTFTQRPRICSCGRRGQ